MKRRRRWASPIAACFKETLPPYLMFSIILKKLFFPDYRGYRLGYLFLSGLSRFSGRGRQKWTLYLNSQQWYNNFFCKIFTSFWTFFFNVFSVTVIAWHSELSILIFRNSKDFPDWRDTTRFFYLQNLNPVSIFVNRRCKPPKIRNLFYDYRVFFWFRATKRDFRFEFYIKKYID